MDPLAQMMKLLKPRALLWKQLDAAGDWIVRFPKADSVVFSLVAIGRCVFRSDAHGSHELREGDFLLMNSPGEWSLADNESATASQLAVHSGPGVRMARIGVDDGELRARLIGGRFVFSDSNKEFLEELLPSFVVISRSDSAATRLSGIFGLLADEAASDRPGRSLALDRLLELMLVEVIRRRPCDLAVSPGGLLAGLVDSQLAPALRAIHADAQRRWTVAELARMSGMSRSIFAERFGRVVGLPPIDYLLRWRMALAKDALLAGHERLATIAERTGYQSVAAFSAAFTRTVGCPPSRYVARSTTFSDLSARDTDEVLE
jgi:AraC-like DNA-binding protein